MVSGLIDGFVPQMLHKMAKAERQELRGSLSLSLSLSAYYYVAYILHGVYITWSCNTINLLGEGELKRSVWTAL